MLPEEDSIKTEIPSTNEDLSPKDAPEMLPGVVLEQYIRCGKEHCRCARGGEKHGPYFYRVWREGSEVHKVYVKKNDAERVRAACLAAQVTALLTKGQKLMDDSAVLLEAGDAIAQDAQRSIEDVRRTVAASQNARKRRREERAKKQ